MCPFYSSSPSELNSTLKEEYIIYSVSREEYETCHIVDPNPRIVAECRSPHRQVINNAVERRNPKVRIGKSNQIWFGYRTFGFRSFGLFGFWMLFIKKNKKRLKSETNRALNWWRSINRTSKKTNDSTTKPNLKTLKSESSDFGRLLYSTHSKNWTKSGFSTV